MKRFLIFGIIIILLLPVLTMADKASEEIDVLRKALIDMEADHHESDMVANGILFKKFLEEKEISKIGEKILDDLGIIGYEADPLVEDTKELGEIYYKEVIFEEDYSQINYYGYDDEDNLISIYLSSYLFNESLSGETYLCINLVKKDDFFKKSGIIDRVESIYKEYDSRIDTSYCSIGTIKGKHSKDKLTKEINKLIREMDGKVISEFHDDSLLSYTIYTPEIEKTLTIDEKKINLNLAVRYNSHEDITYLWIGTPIITIGY